MKEREKKAVRELVENEGFDYAFAAYIDFREIKDNEFHLLRLAYLNARKALARAIDYKE